MKETLFGIFIIVWLAIIVLWVIALIKPKAKVFNTLQSRFNGRKGLSKLFAPLFIISFIFLAVFSPPLAVELKGLNLEADQEVITEQFTIEGEVSGSFKTFLVNNEAITLEKGRFSKTLNLKPGDNKVKILLTYVDEEDKEVEAFNKTHNIYFDYEGMLYARELEKDKQAEDELKRKLAEIPRYETVRKTDIENGFSAIIYVEGNMEDYQITNIAKDIENNNSDTKNISVLMFSKTQKTEVEAVLENSTPSELITYIRANYEKRDSNKQLFWFPKGAEDEKLALEIQ